MDVVVNGIKEAGMSAGSSLLSHGNYYLNFLACLGFDANNPPLADLLRSYHHLDGQWLIVSPIHWHVTHNDAMMVATGNKLELTEEESHLWFTMLAQFFKTDDFSPVYHDSQTWLFKVDSKPAITSQSVYAMLHQSMMPALEAMDHTLFWQRLITEAQMYMSSHPLNHQRQDKLAINGLWFWGGGEFKIMSDRTIVTDDQFLLDHCVGKGRQINEFTQALSFKKNDLILIKHPDQIDLSLLEKNTRKNTTCWYWNNLAYVIQANRWWKPLWR